MATPSKGTVVLDVLLNYFLFTPLALVFWHGTDVLFDILVIDGKTDPRPRAVAVMVAAASFEVFAAVYQRRLNQLSEDILRDDGYRKYFFLTRLYNYLMAIADSFIFQAFQSFYTGYLGPVGPEVHARWAATFLVISLALKIFRSLVCTPLVVADDETLEEEWFDFRLHFETTPSSGFALHLYDAIFSVWFVSLIIDTTWNTLTYTLDGLIYPSDFVKATVVSCAAGYVIVGLIQFLMPLASAASARLEDSGRTVEKLILEDAFLFAAVFATILLWKGLGMCAQLSSETLGPVVGVHPHTMAVINQVLSFLAMCALGISSQLVFKGPSTDGELTNGQGLVFPTQYIAVQPQKT